MQYYLKSIQLLATETIHQYSFPDAVQYFTCYRCFRLSHYLACLPELLVAGRSDWGMH